VRGLEDGVQRDRQLDRAEAAGEVAAGRGAERDQLGAQIPGDVAELGARQPAQIVRLADGRKDAQRGRPPTSSRRMASRAARANGFR